MLVFNFRFADQHHRNVVANRVNSAALSAFQALAAFGQIDWCFTEWADENLQELRIHGHTEHMLPQAQGQRTRAVTTSKGIV